jgi:hypothetical protein
MSVLWTISRRPGLDMTWSVRSDAGVELRVWRPSRALRTVAVVVAAVALGVIAPMVGGWAIATLGLKPPTWVLLAGIVVCLVLGGLVLVRFLPRAELEALDEHGERVWFTRERAGWLVTRREFDVLGPLREPLARIDLGSGVGIRRGARVLDARGALIAEVREPLGRAAARVATSAVPAITTFSLATGAPVLARGALYGLTHEAMRAIESLRSAERSELVVTIEGTDTVGVAALPSLGEPGTAEFSAPHPLIDRAVLPALCVLAALHVANAD